MPQYLLLIANDYNDRHDFARTETVEDAEARVVEADDTAAAVKRYVELCEGPMGVRYLLGAYLVDRCGVDSPTLYERLEREATERRRIAREQSTQTYEERELRRLIEKYPHLVKDRT